LTNGYLSWKLKKGRDSTRSIRQQENPIKITPTGDSTYLEAGIELIDQTRVPEVTVDALKVAYPQLENILDKPKLLTEMGLAEGTQWPVILAGYVVNSLDRPADEIRETPYTPLSGDEFFPPKYPATKKEP